MGIARVSRSITVAAAMASLLGCIVVPYKAPQGQVSDRPEIPATVPDTIVQGKTTRDQVLQIEGTPDGKGVGQAWFVYSSLTKDSGLGLFFCVGTNENVGCGDARRQVWDYRRLVVRFDAAGVVSEAYVDAASCLRWTRDFQSPVPCMDRRGDDLLRADALALLQDKQKLASYERVRWPADQESGCVAEGQLTVTQDALYFVADAGPPSDTSRYVDPPRCLEPDSVVVFDDTDVADISVVKGMSGDQAVKLSRKDGSHLTYQLLKEVPAGHDESVDNDATLPNAAELAGDIKKSTGKFPDGFGGMSEAAEPDARTYDQVRWCSGWHPPTRPIIQTQTPCEHPKDGYLILTATGFTFQLGDAGDGLHGVVAGQYADMRTVSIRDSGRWGSYSHWVVIETKDGQIDAFDPGDSDRKLEINSILQSHMSSSPP